MKIPDRIASEEELEQLLSEPHPALIEMMKRLDGDIAILGVAGKMGVTMAMQAKRAVEASSCLLNGFSDCADASAGNARKAGSSEHIISRESMIRINFFSFIKRFLFEKSDFLLVCKCGIFISDIAMKHMPERLCFITPEFILISDAVCFQFRDQFFRLIAVEISVCGHEKAGREISGDMCRNIQQMQRFILFAFWQEIPQGIAHPFRGIQPAVQGNSAQMQFLRRLYREQCRIVGICQQQRIGRDSGCACGITDS